MRIIAISLAHFVIAMAIAIVAFGWDLDRLRSRSTSSRIAAEVHDVLWWPHDTALRAIPNAWLIRNKWIIPVALVANSLAWGVALYGVTRLVRRTRAYRSSTATSSDEPDRLRKR